MSYLTYVKVSDLNPGEPISFDVGGGMGYGAIPPPRDLYQNTTWDIYGMSEPAFPSGSNGDIYVPQLGRRTTPTPEKDKIIEGFSARVDSRLGNVGTEAPIEDEIYQTKKSYKLKNPLIVLAFLTAFAGGIIFFWSGMDTLLKNYFNKGQPLTWKMYFLYSLIIVVTVFLAAHFLGLDILKIEEMGE